jgi:hypothetical protein
MNGVAQVYPQALGSLSVAFYDSQGYGGGDSNPSPHPGGPVFYSYALTHKFEADRIQNTAPNSASTFCFRFRCRAGMNWSSRVSCYDRRSVGQSALDKAPICGPCRYGSSAHNRCRLPHFLDNWLTDGGEVVSLMRRPHFTSRKIPGTHFC